MPHFATAQSAMTHCVGWTTSLLFAEGAAPAKPGGITALLTNIFPFLMIAVLFYMLMIRPDQRKKAALRDMLKNLTRNDRIVTIGGIYGTVVAISKDAEEVTINVDDNSNTKIRMQRSAIARVLNGETGLAK